jgi:hypothetical protein
LNLRTEDLPVEFESSHAEPLSFDPDPPPRARAYDFDAAAAAVEAAIQEHCEPELEWPARIAAGIRAALAFAVANPEAARALMVDSRADDSDETGDYLRMISRFAELLGQGAPQEQRLPASSDRAVVSAVATIVSSNVRAGTVDSLLRGDTDIIFLVLLPYVGFEEASRWSSPPRR